jgi:tryptophan-rich sensory protein
MTEPAERRAWGRIALVTVPAILLLGSASGWLSNSGYGNSWFDALAKPSFMPPGWLFGVVWPILYALLGLALAMILAAGPSPRRRTALGLFFAGHDIRLANVVLFVMLGLAAATAGQFARLRTVAGLLLIPYLAWLIFAATLNTAIDDLNPGAGSSLIAR